MPLNIFHTYIAWKNLEKTAGIDTTSSVKFEVLISKFMHVVCQGKHKVELG